MKSNRRSAKLRTTFSFFITIRRSWEIASSNNGHLRLHSIYCLYKEKDVLICHCNSCTITETGVVICQCRTFYREKCDYLPLLNYYRNKCGHLIMWNCLQKMYGHLPMLDCLQKFVWLCTDGIVSGKKCDMELMTTPSHELGSQVVHGTSWGSQSDWRVIWRARALAAASRGWPVCGGSYGPPVTANT